MTSQTRVSVHSVASIAVKSEHANSPHGLVTWTEFTFTDIYGGVHEFTAFHEGPLAIQGAEFHNFVAAHEAEEAV